jgi:anti-sigma B factor antagonist
VQQDPINTGPEFTVAESIYQAIRVIALGGELDMNTSSHLQEALLANAENYPVVVADLTDASFIDATGLSAFVIALRQLRRLGGDLSLVGLSPQVKKVFDITGLNQEFAIYYDLKDAISASEAAARNV